MESLVFSEYIKALYNSWDTTTSEEEIAKIVLNSIITTMNVCDSTGSPMALSQITLERLISRTANVDRRIKQAVIPRLKELVYDYCTNRILTHLSGVFGDTCYDRIQECIEKDESLSSTRKDELLFYLRNGKNNIFLAEVLFETLNRDNAVYGRVCDDDFFSHRRRPLEQISEEEKKEKLPYEIALLDVCSEMNTKADCCTEGLLSGAECKKLYERHRVYYYQAEAVRRGARDSFTPEDGNPFQSLKDDIYENVIETFEKDYDSGKERLDEVVAKAAASNPTGSLLITKTAWVGAAQKKGVCHHLVNDGKLAGWVKK